MNYANDPWYESRRERVMALLAEGKPLRGKRERRNSPLGKYTLELTPYSVKDSKCPYYSFVDIVSTADGTRIGKVVRNEADFPFLFIENENGNDYLMCAEDYQGFTIICINSGKRWNFVPEKARRDLALRITDFHLSPNRKNLGIEGFIRAKPSDLVDTDEIHFFKISDLCSLPYQEVDKRVTFAYDKAIGWETDERFVISRIEDIVIPSGVCLDEITNQDERIAALKDGNLKKQTVYYAYCPKTGEMQKVFSEWR